MKLFEGCVRRNLSTGEESIFVSVLVSVESSSRVMSEGSWSTGEKSLVVVSIVSSSRVVSEEIWSTREDLINISGVVSEESYSRVLSEGIWSTREESVSMLVGVVSVGSLAEVEHIVILLKKIILWLLFIFVCYIWWYINHHIIWQMSRVPTKQSSACVKFSEGIDAIRNYPKVYW